VDWNRASLSFVAWQRINQRQLNIHPKVRAGGLLILPQKLTLVSPALLFSAVDTLPVSPKTCGRFALGA
jgi:hypothetical protein